MSTPSGISFNSSGGSKDGSNSPGGGPGGTKSGGNMSGVQPVTVRGKGTGRLSMSMDFHAIQRITPKLVR